MNYTHLNGPSTAYIALGSNLGERERYLLEALRRLQHHEHIRVSRCSSIYETDPVGIVDQGPFLNMAAKLETTLTPMELLEWMMQVEAELGRVRNVRWGPRTIDLDMLLYEKAELNTDKLTLPHPRMHERAFVLIPLADIIEESDYPEWRELLDKCEDKGGVRLWKKTDWHREFVPSES
ncbi:2-amino-4-hydroxy-6-hydroxymethyldihydropteridine diphosphokinase [Paenibacillus senegalensis]|uniref:2-amino-4-hydroxy-6- hydroxymethyldihydropteridine diphosphokinase n=1 Tax=Paenibacillus senegalensis TaxID=1465766 RepID=UPI000289C10A|nr:2-amino-4-hydroxy-6-hydroxymethyldihydropteridine diphosphokinase [Paenibacillus senegalensis]